MNLEALFDKDRLCRVLNANIAPPEINPPAALDITQLNQSPACWAEALDEPEEDIVELLRAELTPEQRAHCAQGNEPFMPGSEEERLFNRMHKFGMPMAADTPAAAQPIAPVTTPDSFLSDERMKARMERFGTVTETVSAMTDDRLKARMAKFGTS